MAAQGRIVLLNGTSSAGKTTIAKAFQELMTDEPWLYTGIDPFLAQLHPRWIHRGDEVSSGDPRAWQVVASDGVMTECHIGEEGRRLLRGMYASFAALARAGVNVIADDVIYDEGVLGSAVAALHELDAYFIAIHCPLAIAEQRERNRGDRFPGGARVFFSSVHAGKIYDLEVDSSLLLPSVAATAIADHIKKDASPWAFRRLHNRT